MSLIDQDGFATNTTLTNPYAFYQLFMRADFNTNTTIRNHPTKDIVLPATTLTINCYDQMFSSCKGITRAPELPATTLAEWCYNAMFMDCSALATALDLPATTLEASCYADMFMNCTSLTTAPDLPAATLAEGCYSSMFSGCTSLNYVKCLATDISADYCTVNWLGDVAATGTFVKAADMSDWAVAPDANDNVNGIPAGWTVEDYSVSAAKTPYVVWCYDSRSLYFTYRSETLAVGDAFTPEGSTDSYTITNLWSGDDVTEEWESYCPTYDETQIDYTKAHTGPGGYLRKKHDSFDITIPASGIGTFSADWNVTIPTGLTAYYCKDYHDSDGTVAMVALEDMVIPAGTGVLVEGTPGSTHTLIVTTDDATAISDNALVAVTVPTHVAQIDGDYTNFMLSGGKFYKIKDATADKKMPANKAYLHLLSSMFSSSVAERGITLLWPEATSVTTIPIGSSSPKGIYDLQGRKVTNPSKGIYIIDGKKVSIP